MKFAKKLLALSICVIMLFGTLAVGINGFTELLDAVSVKASATYSVGDTICYGTYPQTDVTAELGETLSGQNGEWKSYNYYSLTDSPEGAKMTVSDYMRYKDVVYKGNKYRGVFFDLPRYYADNPRPDIDLVGGYQSVNGYTAGATYWFKYEPIEWRVLDSDSGLVMCNMIIDSQAYNSNMLFNDDESRANSSANNWTKSSLRAWLNDDFYNTAFTDEEKESIKISEFENSGFADEQCKVFLLSCDEVSNSAYGFDSNCLSPDTARRLYGSDYAKCQGLYVDNSSGSKYYGNSYWWLRSSIDNSEMAYTVDQLGEADCCNFWDLTFIGVAPALRLQNLRNTDFFARIIAFFKNLFRLFPTFIDFRKQ